MHATLAQAAFVLLVCLPGFMTARSAGETFGVAVDLHWTKVALANLATKSKAGPEQDDSSAPPTT